MIRTLYAMLRELLLAPFTLYEDARETLRVGRLHRCMQQIDQVIHEERCRLSCLQRIAWHHPEEGTRLEAQEEMQTCEGRIALLNSRRLALRRQIGCFEALP